MKERDRVKALDGKPFCDKEVIGFVESVDKKNKTIQVCTRDSIHGPIEMKWDDVEILTKPLHYREGKCCKGCDKEQEHRVGSMCHIDPKRPHPVNPWGCCNLWDPKV